MRRAALTSVAPSAFLGILLGVLTGCGDFEIDPAAAATHLSTRWAPVVSELDEPAITDAVHQPECWDAPVDAPLVEPELDATTLEARYRDDPSSLGSASIGSPTRGALRGGVELSSSSAVDVVTPLYNWGTARVVASIERAARRVECRFPNHPPLRVGSISRKRGGHLRPHRSHQSGLDADLGYFYTDGSTWYRRATADNLDRAATLTLLDALYDGGDVEYLFVDRSVKALLREYAETHRPDLLEPLFDGKPPNAPLIRHARGHDTHLHVRFFDEAAQENARRLIPVLIRHEPRLALQMRWR